MVRQRRAPVQAPSLHEVPGMATADEEVIERGQGGFRVEESKGLVGAVSVGSEGRGCCFGVFAHHESGVRRNRENAPGGQRGGGERRGGGPRPALECTFPLSFPFGGLSHGDETFPAA